MRHRIHYPYTDSLFLILIVQDLRDDGKRAQGFGLIYKGRLVCFYTYECDLGNGWEDYGTYPNDTQENRVKALKMGANMIQYALTQ